MDNAVGYLVLAAGLLLVFGTQVTGGLRRVGVSLRLGLRRFRRSKLRRSVPALSLLLLAVLALSAAVLSIWGLASDTGIALGAAGDFFGGILNPLVAFAALIALLYAIRIQKKELQLTTKALEDSSNALRGQERLYQRQLFNQVFAEALADLDSARQEFSEISREHGRIKTGSEAFHSLSREALQRLTGLYAETYSGLKVDYVNELRESAEWYIVNGFEPGRLMRTLEQACIQAANSPDERAHSYRRIALRLSNEELISIYILAFAPEAEYLLAHVEKLNIPEILGRDLWIPAHFGDLNELLRLAHSRSASNPNDFASNS
jgi:hypothetical protein